MAKKQFDKVYKALEEEFENIKLRITGYANNVLVTCGFNSSTRPLSGEDLVFQAIERLLSEGGQTWYDELDLEKNLRRVIFSIAGNYKKKKEQLKTREDELNEQLDIEADEVDSEITEYITALKQKIIDIIGDDGEANTVFEWRFAEDLKKSVICEEFDLTPKKYESAKKIVKTAIGKAINSVEH